MTRHRATVEQQRLRHEPLFHHQESIEVPIALPPLERQLPLGHSSLPDLSLPPHQVSMCRRTFDWNCMTCYYYSHYLYIMLLHSYKEIVWGNGKSIWSLEFGIFIYSPVGAEECMLPSLRVILSDSHELVERDEEERKSRGKAK